MIDLISETKKDAISQARINNLRLKHYHEPVLTEYGDLSILTRGDIGNAVDTLLGPSSAIIGYPKS